MALAMFCVRYFFSAAFLLHVTFFQMNDEPILLH